MCFSTEASFIATAALGATGIVAMKKTERRSDLALAAIPFLFAIQQLGEGVQWLAFNAMIDPFWLTPGKYLFLLFAQVVWPAWVPFAIYRSEPEPRRAKLLIPFLIAGFGLAAYHLYCMMNYNVTAIAGDHHILYRLEYFQFSKHFSNVVYFATAVIPPFLSTNRRMQLVGLANLISLAATFIFYREYLLSVWCYFAALISVSILWAVYPRTDQHNTSSSHELQH